MNTVLYFQPATKTSAPAKLAGARSAANRLGWHLQVIDAKPTPKLLRGLLDLWHPLGMIVDCGGNYNEIDARLFSRSVPTVFLSHDPGTLPRGSFAVHNDQKETARLAARELLTTGYEHFAYIPTPDPTYWSRQREKAFTDAINLNGHRVHVFPGKGMRRLRDFLLALPKPCAVFAVNDRAGSDTLSAAALAGLRVPDELAVIGVDNFGPICEETSPRLTSIEPDFRRGGELAALLLAAVLRDGSAFRGEKSRMFSPLRIVRRESTRLLRANDPEVENALAYIRDHACEGIGAKDVAKTFACSRRYAEMRFRKATGHSILDEIDAVRLECCKELLASDTPLKAIHDFCGISTANNLRRFFHRKTGMTLSAWRKTNPHRT